MSSYRSLLDIIAKGFLSRTKAINYSTRGDFKVDLSEGDDQHLAMLDVDAGAARLLVYEDGECVFEIRNYQRKRYRQLLYQKKFNIRDLLGQAADSLSLEDANDTIAELVWLMEQSLYFDLNGTDQGVKDLDTRFKQLGID